MKRTYLLSYKSTMFQALSTGYTFDLTLQTSYFWGLFKSIHKSVYEVPKLGSINQHMTHWDNLITNHKPIK
jgi:hypothetical protein